VFHLCAYGSSITPVAADVDTPAISDDILFIQNGHFLPQAAMQLLWALTVSNTWLRTKISTPKFRQISPVLIRPGIVGTNPGNNPNIMLLDFSPIRLGQLEEIQILISKSGAVAEQNFTLLALQDAFTPAPVGDIYPLRWTSVGVAGVGLWTTIAVAFDQQLPYGTYQVVWSEHFSATAIAHRHIYDQQYWRPGMPSFQTVGQRLPYELWRNRLGLFGSFHTTNLPRFQVLCTAADAVHEGYLYCVKVG
jgi:hypothetical protein